MTVYGEVAPGFEPVHLAFAKGQALDPGGAQLAVYQGGVKVVDLWTGNDPIRGRAYDANGFGILMSATKALTATVVHLLSERGDIDIDAPVCNYWTEFAQNGKSNITIKMVLMHTSGCCAFPVESGIVVREVLDLPRVIRCLEEMAPFWEPGTRMLYAPYTYGFILGEVVHRITGKTIGTVFREEIASPLDLNLWIGGFPEDKEAAFVPSMPRIPQFASPDKSGTGSNPVPSQPVLDMSNPLVAAYVAPLSTTDTPAFLNTREAHVAEIPAANGIGDARSLAKFYAHLIGEVDGKPRILKKETLQRVTKTQTDGIPTASPFELLYKLDSFRIALGYEKRCQSGQPMIGESSFGHAGSGGRLGFADIESDLAVAYICNNPLWTFGTPDSRWMPWMEELQKIALEGTK
ncbi:beta-lactamase/transpeptidase-like protein [Dacryopinax primogenitus]|uniref:Beta-lactamase/transpeptidase-like protein n=1 Tax=Dacryopinax primogenitus (strain DJM 731) TaxID=1858805 RepID=M5FR67_DACPD|nr:beta-lactamase/transpeptidase-like protein [Dacryopinax primogenitus]EJT97379.1 beta-lactamase/transpeptidase-like protein [Dacryopinax primogenitus]